MYRGTQGNAVLSNSVLDSGEVCDEPIGTRFWVRDKVLHVGVHQFSQTPPDGNGETDLLLPEVHPIHFRRVYCAESDAHPNYSRFLQLHQVHP